MGFQIPYSLLKAGPSFLSCPLSAGTVLPWCCCIQVIQPPSLQFSISFPHNGTSQRYFLFLVASSDLQLAGAIQTAFMWHRGFSLIWFPRLDSAGCGRFYELIPVPHYSAVSH